MLNRRVGNSNLLAVRQSNHYLLTTVCLLFVLVFLMSSLPVLGETDSSYTLGPEDVIIITVLRHTEFSGEFLVPNDGAINVPRVGRISVAGKTLAEIANEITTELKKTLLNPEVTVSLRIQRPQLVYVLGSVRMPGSYPLKPGWRITESISAAGGLVQGIEPADCTIHILRAANGVKESVPYQKAISGDEAENKSLRIGDVVTVEAPETIPFYVMGKVYRPGAYSLRKDMAGLIKAITLAGGTMDDAALSKITITHLNGESETISLLPATTDGNQPDTLMLRSGDLIVVPTYSAKFAVLGWVNSPGVFSMKENQKVTLSEALGEARGIDNKRSGLKQVAILRSTDDKSDKRERIVVDYTKFAKKGDLSQNPEILPGDVILVPQSSKPDWDAIVSRISSGISVLWTLDRLQID